MKGKPACAMSSICPANLSITKGSQHSDFLHLINRANAAGFTGIRKMSHLFFSLLRITVKYLSAGYFYLFIFLISLWSPSGQGYSNCMLCCPAVQSPIVIWMGFVAFISGGISWSGYCRVTVWCHKGICYVCIYWERVFQGGMVKAAVGFVTDRCFPPPPRCFLPFFLMGCWKINISLGQKEIFL